MNSVLLTVDLTKAVVDEAIERKDSIIIAYRALPFTEHRSRRLRADAASSIDPIIFKGLKSLTLGNSQQQSLLRLAAEGISVGDQPTVCRRCADKETRYTARTQP